MRWWKVAGLAGVAGVAATGAVVVRDQRKRRSYTPEEIRGRLHTRFQEQDESQRDAGSGRAVAASEPDSALGAVQGDVRTVVPRRRWRPRWARRRRKA